MLLRGREDIVARSDRKSDKMTSKRICVVGNGATKKTVPAGSWITQNTGRFLKDLQREGWKVTYCELSLEGETVGFLQSFDLKSNEVKSWGIPARPYFMRFQKMLQLSWRLRTIDFVYIFFPGTLGRHVALLCRLFSIPYGLYVRGEKFGGSSSDIKTIACAKFALTVSPTLQNRLLEHCNNVSLIRPMTDITEGDFVLRDSSRFSPVVWKLFYAGRLEERKGTFDLFDIALHLRKLEVPFLFRLAGNGPAESRLRKLIAEHHLDGQIKLLGFLDSASELSKQFEKADAFVFPSHDEGFPRVILEAMAKSLPVFTTMVGGIPGIAQDGVNCLEIPVQNPHEAANVIHKELNNPRRLEEVSREGFQTAMNVFSIRPHHSNLLSAKLSSLLS